MANEGKPRGGTVPETQAPETPVTEREAVSPSELHAATRVRLATPGPEALTPSELHAPTQVRPATPHPDLLEPPAEVPLLPVDAEHYEVGEEVARGGLGRILSARDKRLNRRVAVKVLRVRDAQAESRFMREALITARLQHPAIVPIYEAGRWPDGEPFYAMKLLHGKSLAELIDERPTLEGRLALLPNVIAVCEAIAFAHENRIIHRDLKPANVMVGEYGETLVIDWGLAKDLDQQSSESAGFSSVQSLPPLASGDTVAGSVLGTPAYMPPEQASGHAVDERADVYSLGAVLYHLLSGAVPLGRLSAPQAMQRVMSGPLPAIARVVRGVHDDLGAIVGKAMAFARADRYPSARELAADLRRFATGQLVSARTYVWWERLERWVRKYRAVVAVATTAFAVLAAFGVYSVQRIVEERNDARAQRQEAERARQTADQRGDALVLVQAQTALERDPTAALAWLKQHPGGDALPLLRTVASDAESRGAAAHVLRMHRAHVQGLGFGAGPDELVSAGADGRLVRWDLRSGHGNALIDPPGMLWVLARTPDGRTFAAVGSSEHLRLVTVGQPDRLLERGPAIVLALAFSPDGRWLAAGPVDGRVTVWELATLARRELTAHAGEVRGLAFSADGTQLASASYDGSVQLTRLEGRFETRKLPTGKEEQQAVAFSPDGRLLASGGVEGVLRIWHTATFALTAHPKAHAGGITGVAFSTAGLLATAGRDDLVRVWSAPFTAGRALEGHTADVLQLQFSPDGRLLASSGADRAVRLWDIATWSSRPLLGHEGSLTQLAFSPDSQRLASAGHDGSVRVWSTRSAGERVAPGLSAAVLSRRSGAVLGSTATGALRSGERELPGGKRFRWFGFVGDDRVVALSHDRDVLLYENGEPRVLGRLPVDCGSAALLQGHLAVGAYDGTVRLWRLSDGAATVQPAHQTYTLSAEASPDGALLATGGDEGSVRLWSAVTGDERRLAAHTSPVHRVRFSPDGRLLATGDLSGELKVWNAAAGTLALVDRHRSYVRALAFSRDGALLASSGDDKTVRVRQLSTRHLVELTGPEQPVLDLAFSADGRLVAAASADGTVRVFDWASRAARVLRGHRGPVTQVVFTQDALLSVDAEGGARRWSRDEVQPLPDERPALGKWLDSATSARIDEANRPATENRAP